MPAFDGNERASFDGLEFRVRSVRIRNSLRYFTHVFRRVPGGGIEKFGRGLWEIEMDAIFHATEKGYAQQWPNVVASLRDKFASELTSELVIPTIGRMRAFIANWDELADSKIRSGVSATIQFVEDEDAEGLAQSVFLADTRTMQAALDQFEGIKDVISPRPSLFDAITAAANSVLAVKDQLDLFGMLVESKILGLVSLLDQADTQLRELQQPQFQEVHDAILAMWDSAFRLSRDIAEGAANPSIYIVPATMTVGQISSALYNSSDRGTDIMRNNNLGDPFAVGAGTQIFYFPDAA